jgi:DNA-binding transcriptional LysR family regulator
MRDRKLAFLTAAVDHGARRRSTVSKRVRSLEDQLQIPLFERHSRGVKPTSVGARFLSFASCAAQEGPRRAGS